MRIEQVWAFQRRGQRAVAAIVHAEMRRAEFDTDGRPLRALVRIFQEDGSLLEQWTPCRTREEALAKLHGDRPAFLNADDPWTEITTSSDGAATS